MKDGQDDRSEPVRGKRSRSGDTVRAAGCVLWRRAPRDAGAEETEPFGAGLHDAEPFGAGLHDAEPFGGGSHDAEPYGGGIQIALVHRPKYDDWSHAKGKLEPGESASAGALREVAEETGMHCEPGPELSTVRYMVKGGPKEVRYWAAEVPPDEHFVPNPEVDRLLWLPPEAARLRLTHEHDRRLIDELLNALDLV